MTIQQIIDGAVTSCPGDWQDLQKELAVLESEMDYAYDQCDRVAWQELRETYRKFRNTDTGYRLVRGY